MMEGWKNALMLSLHFPVQPCMEPRHRMAVGKGMRAQERRCNMSLSSEYTEHTLCSW